MNSQVNRPNRRAPRFEPAKAKWGADDSTAKKQAMTDADSSATWRTRPYDGGNLTCGNSHSSLPPKHVSSSNPTENDEMLDTSAKTTDSTLSESEKTQLALRVSTEITTSTPGAHHWSSVTDPSHLSAKPSQEQLLRAAQLRTEQKIRNIAGEDPEDDSDRLPLDSESQTLDDLQGAMTSFREKMEKEVQEEQKFRRRKRCLVALITAGLLLMIVALVAGLVAGLGGGSSGEEPSGAGSSPIISSEQECSTVGLDSQSDRFLELRSSLIFYDSTIDMAGSNARLAVCWLSSSELLKDEAVQPYDILQHFALVVTYYHFIRGAPLAHGETLDMTNWLSDSPICDWAGVECQPVDGLDVVWSLSWKNLYLGSSIPSHLGLLTSIRNIRFGNCAMTGSVPTQLWGLSLLESLSFGSNFLTGTLSGDINRLQRLKEIEILQNRFRGSLPDIFQLELLTHFHLFESGFTGTFPDLSSSANLESLFIYGSELSGDIPSFIFDLNELKLLNISGSSVSGTIPTEIGTLSVLESLDLSTNLYLSGTLPTELGFLTMLTELRLIYTALSGTIPTEFGQLSLLESFQISKGESPISSPFQFDMPPQVCVLLNQSLTTLVGDCRYPCSCCTSCRMD